MTYIGHIVTDGYCLIFTPLTSVRHFALLYSDANHVIINRVNIRCELRRLHACDPLNADWHFTSTGVQRLGCRYRWNHT